MSNPLWMRSAMVAVALGLFGAASCGESGNGDNQDDRDACDLVANPDLDCDGDGMPNGWEATNGFDPLDPDENKNGVLDGWEDPDDDGLPTWAEIALGLDYLTPKTQVPGGKQNDIIDGLRDHDGDGSVNMAEAWVGEADSAKGIITQLWDPASKEGAKPYVCSPTDEVADSTLFKPMAFRFTQLQVTVPQLIGGVLSGIMAPDIRGYVLNVLAPVANFEFGHCVSYFDLYAGSGDGPEQAKRVTSVDYPDKTERDQKNAEIDAANKLISDAHVFVLEDMDSIFVGQTLPETKPVRAVVIQTSDNTAFFRTVTPLSMIFPGTLPVPNEFGDPKGRFALELTYITAAGTLTIEDDGSVSLEAFIDGVIPFEAAKNTTVQLSADKPPQTIDDLMVGGAPKFSRPGSDEELGYNLRASFRAKTVIYDDGTAGD